MTELSLPKTKISYRDGMLTKRGSGDSVVASFNAKDISGIRLDDEKEYGPATVFGVGSLALAVVAKTYIESPGWSWVATIGCLAVTGFSLLMINVKKIVITTSSGVVSYPIADPFEEAEGFVLSLRHQIEDGDDPGNDGRNDGENDGENNP